MTTFDHQSQAFHGHNPVAAQPAQETISPVQAEVEKHKKISIEPELDDFNTRLADPVICQKYVSLSSNHKRSWILNNIFNHFSWTTSPSSSTRPTAPATVTTPCTPSWTTCSRETSGTTSPGPVSIEGRNRPEASGSLPT